MLAGKVTLTTGGVVSTVTTALLALSDPTQSVPVRAGVSVYFQLPSGTEDSVHVFVPVPLHVAVTNTPVPPAAG
jgi:hypothetical protein